MKFSVEVYIRSARVQNPILMVFRGSHCIAFEENKALVEIQNTLGEYYLLECPSSLGQRCRLHVASARLHIALAPYYYNIIKKNLKTKTN